MTKQQNLLVYYIVVNHVCVCVSQLSNIHVHLSLSFASATQSNTINIANITIINDLLSNNISPISPRNGSFRQLTANYV